MVSKILLVELDGHLKGNYLFSLPTFLSENGKTKTTFSLILQNNDLFWKLRVDFFSRVNYLNNFRLRLWIGKYTTRIFLRENRKYHDRRIQFQQGATKKTLAVGYRRHSNT